ncbi:Uncharacterised protein [Serratia fonticola]|uniref:Uncharacterized protein n=1 Tax=Serratia fonticola TaxID=47917 RepID=A0A4U9TN76_SERFO|nr:Uncharacterised protein [Serratia fonticola]
MNFWITALCILHSVEFWLICIPIEILQKRTSIDACRFWINLILVQLCLTPFFGKKNACISPVPRVLELAEQLLAKENGAEVILNGLGMRLHGKKATEDMPDPELLQIGLRAAIQALQKDADDRGGLFDDFYGICRSGSIAIWQL